jgi:hypothetical protein
MSGPTEKDKFLRELNEGLGYSAEKFNGQTLGISAAALGFSLSFIKDIVPFELNSISWILYTSQAFSFFPFSPNLFLIFEHASNNKEH